MLQLWCSQGTETTSTADVVGVAEPAPKFVVTVNQFLQWVIDRSVGWFGWLLQVGCVGVLVNMNRQRTLQPQDSCCYVFVFAPRQDLPAVQVMVSWASKVMKQAYHYSWIRTRTATRAAQQAHKALCTHARVLTIMETRLQQVYTIHSMHVIQHYQ